MATITAKVLKTSDVSNSQGSIRENLSKLITNVSRQDTKFLSSLATEKTRNTQFDWQTDSDAAPVTDNHYAENVSYATVYAANNQKNRLKLRNYVQYLAETVQVTNTVNMEDVNGISKESLYQITQAFRVMKKSYEASITSNNVASSDIAANLTPITAGAFAWAGVVVNANGAALVADSDKANGTIVATSATTTITSMTKAHTETMLQNLYENSGEDVSILMCSPLVRSSFSKVWNTETNNTSDIRRLAAMEKAINSSIAKVSTDFGTIGIVPNWIMKTSNLNKGLFYNPKSFKNVVFSDFKTVDQGQDGDNRKEFLTYKAGLKCLNSASVGALIYVK